MFQSIRFRLTAIFLIIFGTTLIGLSIAGYQFFVGMQQKDFDSALYNHAVDISTTINLDFFGRLSVHFLTPEGLAKRQPFPIERSFMQVRSIQGNIIARSANLEEAEIPLPQPEYKTLLDDGVLYSKIEGKNLSTSHIRKQYTYRIVNYVISKPNVPPLILQLAAPMSYLESVNREIFSFLVIGIPLILAIATFLGFYTAQRALVPVANIIDKAEAIDLSRLNERVPVPETKDEIFQLALTVNRLLDRVQTSIEANDRFVANASHQIKTPLAILKGEIDLLLSRPRSGEETQKFLMSASDEIKTLTRLIENLLVLARIDAGHQSLEQTQFRFDEVALEVIQKLEPLAAQKSLRLKIKIAQSSLESESFFETKGDSELLKNMFTNLIENAIKYSPENNMIEIELGGDNQYLAFRVSDNGPGISNLDLPHVFDRFYRSASSKGEGFGLGLPIAQRICDLHSGLIKCESEIGKGTQFTTYIKKI